MSSAPGLSVITVTPDGLEAIEPITAAVRAQTAADRIELVVVAPRKPADGPGGIEGFAASRVVPVGPLQSLGRAIAAGVRAASAPVVAYAEEHSYPEPGWAATLIERHREPWAAVGWAMENANPGGAVSWAHLLADFGPGVAPVTSGESRMLPWHHTSYKREELLAYGDLLGPMLEAEGVLHEQLLARGRRLYLEASTASRHLNVSRSSANLRSHFHGGRGFGSARARLGNWSLPRRLLYALGFPLVPLVRLRRLLPDVRRAKTNPGWRRGVIVVLAPSLTVNAFGEAIGYLFGEGGSRQKRLSLELERARYLRSQDAG